VASLRVPFKVGRIFSAYFVATFATVTSHNTLCFIICWVIFKIHPYVISTFATTNPVETAAIMLSTLCAACQVVGVTKQGKDAAADTI